MILPAKASEKINIITCIMKKHAQGEKLENIVGECGCSDDLINQLD